MAKILVVDDEEPVRELLAMVLEAVGHQVQQAIHGRQALDLAAQQPPDLVIVDAMMPVMGGAELCRRLKSTPSTAAVPVILMSAAGAPAARGANADAFLAKPFNLSDMETLVQQWLPPGLPGEMVPPRG
jgi:CheY-like chemotaxis protein